MTTFKKTCRQCGVAYEAKKAHSEFCCTAHRQAFDNLQASRGGELYPFLMNWRYGESRDGKRADGTSRRKRDMEALQILTKLLEGFHMEDEIERKNRPTYLPTQAALAKIGGNIGGLTRLPGVPDGRLRPDRG